MPEQTENTTEDDIKKIMTPQTKYKINSSVEILDTVITFQQLRKTQNLEAFITLNYPKFRLKTLPHIIKGDLIINGFFNSRTFKDVSVFELKFISTKSSINSYHLLIPLKET